MSEDELMMGVDSMLKHPNDIFRCAKEFEKKLSDPNKRV